VNGLILAADVGATNMRVGVFDEKIELARLATSSTPQTNVSESVPRALLNLARQVAEEMWGEIVSCGVASIGPLDSGRGLILKAPNIAEKGVEIPLLSLLMEELSGVFYHLNDCNAAAYGEWMAFRDRGVENLVYITISSGIGGGAVDNGHLVLGRRGNGVEIGHITIDPSGYMQCGCGGYGHWEAYASGANIPRLAEKLLRDGQIPRDNSLSESIVRGTLDAKRAFELYYAGDRGAAALFDRLKSYLAAGLASVINAFEPDILVIGGAIYLNNRSFFRDEVFPAAERFLLLEMPTIVETARGDLAPLYGAAYAARDRLEGAKVVRGR
jgi:glucokinase